MKENYTEFTEILKSKDFAQIKAVIDSFWRIAFNSNIVPLSYAGAAFSMKLLTLSPSERDEQEKNLVRIFHSFN